MVDPDDVLYVVTGARVLRYNSGFIKLITPNYREAFEKAGDGEYIYAISVSHVEKVKDVGKVATRLDGGPFEV